MSSSITDRVIIVTGAAGGIGEAISRRLSAEGARVVLTGRNEAKLAQITAELPGPAVYVAVSLTDADAPERILAAAKEHFGDVDVLVNNAAYNVPEDHDLADADLDVWQETVAVNLFAPMRLFKAVLPGMLAKGTGSVINISSGASLLGDVTRPAYGSSKAALDTFTRYSAVQYGPKGIRSNVISPGMIVHPSVAGTMGNPYMDAVQAAVPATRIGEPDDIAGAVLFLAGDDSSFVNGQIIQVDGGATSIGAHVAGVLALDS